MLLVWMFVGCPGEAVKSDDSAPPLNHPEDTAPVICDGTDPVLADLTVAPYDGLYSFEGQDSPALTVSAAATDDDGDISELTLELWWDDVVDGSVDTSGDATSTTYQFSQDPCEGFANNLGLIFEVDGNRFDYATPYEFAGVVTDEAGLVSAIVVASGVSPNEDGTAAAAR